MEIAGQVLPVFDEFAQTLPVFGYQELIIKNVSRNSPVRYKT